MAIKKLKEKTEESQAYVGYLAKIEIQNHEGIYELELPSLTTGILLRLSKKLGKFIQEISSEFPADTFKNLFSNSEEAEQSRQYFLEDFLMKLPTLLPLFIDSIIDILSDYLNEDREWIETFDIENIIKIFSPFLLSVLKQGQTALNLFVQVNPEENQQ